MTQYNHRNAHTHTNAHANRRLTSIINGTRAIQNKLMPGTMATTKPRHVFTSNGSRGNRLRSECESFSEESKLLLNRMQKFDEAGSQLGRFFMAFGAAGAAAFFIAFFIAFMAFIAFIAFMAAMVAGKVLGNKECCDH